MIKLLGPHKMSTEEKVELVGEVKDRYGLNKSLQAVELPKSTWYYWRNQKQEYAARHEHLRVALEEIAKENPEYGYRRAMIALKKKFHHHVNHKVVQRLHNEWSLALIRKTRSPKPHPLREIIRQAGDRANLVADLEEIHLFDVLYTDFTEIRYANGEQKAYFMPLLDHASRLCAGWAVGERANRDLALLAWKRAKQQTEDWKFDLKNTIIHHDQDSVYTSYDWTGQILRKEELRLSYALSGAKDNPYMESFFSRFKAEGHSEFLAAKTLIELEEVIDRRINFYNTQRYHSSLGYRAPLIFIREVYPDTLRLHI